MSVTFYRPNHEQGLNVTNANFRAIMELLGIDEVDGPDGLCGVFKGDALLDLQDRICFVLSNLEAVPALDAGTPVTVYAPNVIDCGRRDGYFTDRLRTLLVIVETAIANNEPVCFA